MQRFNWSQLDRVGQQAALARPALADSADLAANVKAIIAKVRAEGDAALQLFSQQFDGLTDNPLRLSEAEQQRLLGMLQPERKAAIELA